MPWDGPILFSTTVADGFAWAHYICGTIFRWFRLGPLFYGGGAADALGRAHCARSSSCRPLGLGPLIFRETLLMRWDGPILFSTTVADGFAWAQHICVAIFRWFRLGSLFYGGGCCRCLRKGPLCPKKQLLFAWLG